MKRSERRVLADLTAGLSIQDSTLPGRNGTIAVRRYRRPGTTTSHTLVWAHGGAFSQGGLDQLESHAVGAALAQDGIDVVAVDYRLVPAWSAFRDPPAGTLPGTRYPIPMQDVLDAFTAVRADRPDALLGGASAGACLAAAVALRLVADAAKPPGGLVLAYGTFHASLPAPGPDLRKRVRGRHGILQFRESTVHRMNLNYAGSAEAMNDRFAFPGGHDLRGMPPALVLDADRDTLRASGQAFAAELAGAGTTVEHKVLADTTHGVLNTPTSPRFAEAITTIVTWLRSAVQATDPVERKGLA